MGRENSALPGIALWISVATEALGGTLTATSELGEGSCFTLKLPLEESEILKTDDFSNVAPGADMHFTLPEGETRSVLIADDRETNRDILSQVMSGAGFEVVLTTDTGEGDEPATEPDPVAVFAALPEEIIGDLAGAAKVRNLTKLNEMVAGLLGDEETSAAGRHLESLVGSFDFAGVQTLVDELAPAENKL